MLAQVHRAHRRSDANTQQSGAEQPGFSTIERVLVLLNVVVALVAVAFKNAYT